MTLLYVYQPGVATAAMEGPGMDASGGPEDRLVERTLETQRREQLARLRERLPRDVGAETRFEIGVPSDVVIDAAEDFDMLVVGSTERGVFARLLERDLPSSARRNTDCTLVIVPTEGQA